MITEKKGCLAFAVCGSFCTLEDALGAAQALTAQGWTLLPVMSFAAQQDTRFGTCLLYTSPSPRDAHESRMPSSA